MRILHWGCTVALLAATPSLAWAESRPQPVSSPAAEAPSTAPAAASSAALATVISDYERYLRGVDPVMAGMDGDQEALSRWPNSSRAFELEQTAPLQAFVDRLEAIDLAGLGHAERINHAFMLKLVSTSLEAIPLDMGRLSFESFSGPGMWATYISPATRLGSLADAEAWLQRIETFDTLYAVATENARRGMATGLMQARSVTESAIVVARNEAEVEIADEPLLLPFTTLPTTVSQADKDRLTARATRLVRERVAPARRAWLAFLETEYLPRAPIEPGLAHRPDGAELYAYTVRNHTTLDLTPQQVHEIGLSEVARIRASMDSEIRASGWTGGLAGFFEFLRTDPQFYATTREDLIEKASEMAKRADGALPGLFRTLPRLPYNIIETPASTQDVSPTGRYSLGSMPNGVPGSYEINTSRLDQRPLYELPALTLHEAVPGHHLQMALQQEAADEPYFRRQAYVTAFSEGWGLYAEFLGEEMGFYRTPYERFGRLSYEMWRACRLVADTGLHWKGWTTEQAKACFQENTALTAHNIEAEVQRYISWPGQATAYKIGEIRLREIRGRAERELGAAFDIRTFHDALISAGPLPLDLLDNQMDIWIAAQKSGH